MQIIEMDKYDLLYASGLLLKLTVVFIKCLK